MSDQNQTNLGDALKAMLESYKLKGRYQQSRIRSLWPKLMGPAIAQYTLELRLHRKTLHVHLASAPLKHELSMGTDKIARLLNEELGEEVVEKVVIR